MNIFLSTVQVSQKQPASRNCVDLDFLDPFERDPLGSCFRNWNESGKHKISYFIGTLQDMQHHRLQKLSITQSTAKNQAKVYG